ncbi:hypothetical protein [Aquisalibacillus elongatus]|uniref:Uncharacterized protein n=1 Tax=Aquisalibacillus elongatus TaxID=485577 RepID=A0A3N5BAL8_9BACI|nr:hypothetical protein [Aquisalibacillus elongatus]RPF54433.1 hypothetical protein EDC24_1632 [Aquisalibacillus elongatus]
MASREVIKSEEVRELFSDKTNDIVENFLKLYESKSSRRTYKSKINKLLFSLEKEVTEITIDDYYAEINKNGQNSHKESFFKFLYAFEYLRNPDGFNSLWIKENLIEEFSKENRKKQTKKKKTNEPLSVLELTTIQQILKKDFTRLELHKMDFCWYMLFELGCSVEEVKELKSNQLANGFITTHLGNNLKIPERFNRMFDELNKRDNNYNGFYTVHVLIAELGEMAGLERKLTPIIIKKTRNANMLTCSNCIESYWNTTDNWFSINNRVICKKCSDELKKN